MAAGLTDGFGFSIPSYVEIVRPVARIRIFFSLRCSSCAPGRRRRRSERRPSRDRARRIPA